MKGNFHVQFLGEGVAATSPPYPTLGWATTQVYPARNSPGKGQRLERDDGRRLPRGKPFFGVGPEPLQAGIISPPIADLLPCPEETGERLGIVGFEGNGFFKGDQCGRPVFLDDQKVAEPTLHLGGLGLEAHRGFVTGLGVVVPPQQARGLDQGGNKARA